MRIIYSAIKAPHWYAVQVSDTTMFLVATSLFGQKYLLKKLLKTLI